MYSLNIVYKQLKDKIYEKLRENNKSTYIDFFEETELVQLDEKEAIIVTPYGFNKSILSDVITEINDSFLELLNQNVSCIIETTDNYQKNYIIDTITKDLSDNLLPDFSFENFIEGPSNKEAKMAALGCAMKPGEKFFNPLVIYGDSGLGKTHLLHAIGNYIKQKDFDKKILYITSLDFVKEVGKSLRDNTIEEYKSQLNSVDILLVDDIQFLSGKQKSNEIFFTIYNELFNNRKQVVLTSDRPPVQIKDIEDRLKTRFSQGLSVTISSLEFETAVKILELKLKNHHLDKSSIDSDVISFIAKNFSTDVRNLEGALNRLLFYSINFSKGQKIDLPLVLEAFKDKLEYVSYGNKELSSKLIIRAVADYYSLTEKQIVSRSRTKNITTARHIAMYLCRIHLDYSYKKIGNDFGGRDHTTVLSAFEKIQRLKKENELYRKIINDIEKMFTNSY